MIDENVMTESKYDRLKWKSAIEVLCDRMTPSFYKTIRRSIM